MSMCIMYNVIFWVVGLGDIHVIKAVNKSGVSSCVLMLDIIMLIISVSDITPDDEFISVIEGLGTNEITVQFIYFLI